MEKEKTGVISVALKLFVICFVSTLILAFVNTITKDVIKKNSDEAFKKACKEVVSACADIKIIELKEYPEVDAALLLDENKKTVGIAIRQSVKGYNKGIDLLTCVKNDGVTLYGLDIIDHQETPGYGARADEPKFTKQFEGKSAPVKTIENGGEIEAISGATKTTKGILDSGVNVAVKAAKAGLEKEGLL